MESSEILRAVYNDKEVLKKIRKSLKKIRKSIEEYAINLKSMDQLKRDSKDIENHVKETYGLPSTRFKKIVKASLAMTDNVDEVIDELDLIRIIAKSEA